MAVPLRIGHYWIQALFSAHAVAAYDISDLAHIREVSRVTFDDKQTPHWIASDADGHRIRRPWAAAPCGQGVVR